MKNSKIVTFYHPKMSIEEAEYEGYSKSPMKPKLMIEYLRRNNLLNNFILNSDFQAFTKEDFYIAHTRKMVDDFFDKGKTSRLLNIKWTEEYAESVRYENASLYYAIRHAVNNPQDVTFSPSSGFHHATPVCSALFCAFSGQVIASMKIYTEYGLCGAYIDLDGHHGNSIDNARDFVPEIDQAISPVCGNININTYHEKYLADLRNKLIDLKKEVINNRVNYIVFCHGADSHEWDDLGMQLNTAEWISCSNMVYSFISETEKETNKNLPLVLSLFGGYRNDDFDSVLSLHTADLCECLNKLCGQNINYVPEVKTRQ